jgi:hypothetical protein
LSVNFYALPLVIALFPADFFCKINWKLFKYKVVFALSDSQGFDQKSNSTLAKLLEVDSELAVTEAELLSQLESIHAKRRSLKIVISMFTKADTLDAVTVDKPVQTSPAETGKELEPDVEDLVAPPLETSRANATVESETEAADIQSKGAKKTAPSPTTRNKTTKFTQTGKAAKKASGWQQYVREEFTNTSLPEAVYAVLQRQANQVFEISAIVNAIFVDHLPTQVGSKARRQVSNILSEGARKNKWYRGQLGQYSMSGAAAEANSSP